MQLNGSDVRPRERLLTRPGIVPWTELLPAAIRADDVSVVGGEDRTCRLESIREEP